MAIGSWQLGRNRWRTVAICYLLSAICLTACTPQEQAFQAHTSGVPALEEGVFHTSDRAELPYRQWLPKRKPKAVIIALHGFNDYSSAFAYSGEYFAERGMAVVAYDQRGFGHTRNIGFWAGQDNLVRDLREFTEQVQAKYPRTPVYILGESMGGAVAIIALAQPDFPKINGVILSAPAVWGAQTMSELYRATLWVAAHTIPYHEFTGSDLKIIASSNIPMLRVMAHDPLVIKSTRIDAIYGLVHLMDEAYQDIPQLHTPVLMLYGANDQVIPPGPIASARERFTTPLTYAYYPEGFHMLLRDLDRDVPMEDIRSWIRTPATPLPSGFDEQQ